MALLHQIFRQAQSSICLNSPVLLNLTLFPDRFTALRINATFQKVRTVCGTAAALLCALHRRLNPTVSVSNAHTLLFLKVGIVCGALSIALFANVCSRPFHRVTNNTTFQKVGTVSGTLSIVLSANVYSRPFHRVTHKCNISIGRNCLRRPAALEFDGICGKVFLDHKSDLEDDSVIELS